MSGGALAAELAATTAPEPLPLKELQGVARRAASGLGDPQVKTALVVETTHRAALDVVSVGQNPKNDPAAFASPRVFVFVLRGHFKCDACSRPSNTTPVQHGSVVTLVWSTSRGTTDFGITDRLPKPLALLGDVRTIRLR